VNAGQFEGSCKYGWAHGCVRHRCSCLDSLSS
jgi:hypothetical protein